MTQGATLAVMDMVKTWLIEQKALLEAIAAVFAIIAGLFFVAKTAIAWVKVITSKLERNNPVLIENVRYAIWLTLGVIACSGAVLLSLHWRRDGEGLWRSLIPTGSALITFAVWFVISRIWDRAKARRM